MCVGRLGLLVVGFFYDCFIVYVVVMVVWCVKSGLL